MKSKTLLISLTFLLVLSLLSSILVIVISLKTEETEKQIIEEETEFNCENLSLQRTANCLVNYINTFYNYTIRSDKNRTLEDIKINGGDCRDYSLLYQELAESIGYKAYTLGIRTEKSAHRFAIIMDDTGYCTLDLINKPNCLKFKK